MDTANSLLDQILQIHLECEKILEEVSSLQQKVEENVKITLQNDIDVNYSDMHESTEMLCSTPNQRTIHIEENDRIDDCMIIYHFTQSQTCLKSQKLQNKKRQKKIRKQQDSDQNSSSFKSITSKDIQKNIIHKFIPQEENDQS